MWQRALGSSQGPTILVVDSVEMNRRLFRAMLKAAPYRILEATRPTQALHILETEKVDLVVVDMVMPELSGRLKSLSCWSLLPVQSQRRVDHAYMASWFQYLPVSKQAPRKMARSLARSETAKT